MFQYEKYQYKECLSNTYTIHNIILQTKVFLSGYSVESLPILVSDMNFSPLIIISKLSSQAHSTKKIIKTNPITFQYRLSVQQKKNAFTKVRVSLNLFPQIIIILLKHNNKMFISDLFLFPEK